MENPLENYLENNRKTWNERVGSHVQSDFYNLPEFLNGKSSLNALELGLLGDIAGKKLLHLQCHFGMDTLSLARMGADVTGLDFSQTAIDKAIEISAKLGLQSRFVCADVYAAPEVLDAKYDIIFTSYGTIGWLPDAEKWGQVISHLLSPGGRFVMVDFHPLIWMMDAEFSKIEYSYFNGNAIVETETGSYADKENPTVSTSISWNHGMAEIISSLLKAGLQLTHFDEHNYSHYPCFQNLEQMATDKWQISHLKGMVPMMYSIEAIKH